MLRVIFLATIVSLVRAQSQVYGQCGGIGWTGPTTCTSGSTCFYKDTYYSQCLPSPSGLIPIYGQCGGMSWTGSASCESGLVCLYINDYYFQCLPNVTGTSSKSTTTRPKTTTRLITKTTTKFTVKTITVPRTTTRVTSKITTIPKTTTKFTVKTTTVPRTTTRVTSKITTIPKTTTKFTVKTTTVPRTTTRITTKTTTPIRTSTKSNLSQIYEQCGGLNWPGPKTCVNGTTCVYKDIYYSQCLPSPSGLIPIYSQCGGLSWAGPNTCDTGLVCLYINDYYFQCLPNGTTSLQKTSTRTQEGSSSSETKTETTNFKITNNGFNTTTQRVDVATTQQSTSSSEATNGTLAPVTDSIFPGKTFKHGIAFDGSMTDNDYQSNDYISIWINSPWSDQPSKTDFNPWWQGAMVQKSKQFNKIPLFYAYVIAFEARAKQGLQDCDVDPSKNLCYQGANFIRNNRALLVSRYTHQATEIAKALGDSNAPCVFVMEPDLWQYYGDNRQQGGPLSGDYMRLLYDDFAIEIRKQLPNAKISWDLSAWIGVDGMNNWWGFFKTSSYVDFVHTSGGQGQASSDYFKPNELKWSDFSRITGKRIIADCGYGIGGGSSSNCGAWTLENKKLRITDGVIALSGAQGAKQSPPNMDRLPIP